MLSRTLRETLIIVLVAAATALAVNALRPGGLPLKAPTPAEVAAATGTGQGAVSPAAAIETGGGAIDLATAAARHRQGGSTVFVDARSPEAYTAGHIRGALNLPLQRFDDHADDFLNRVPPEAAIVAYCDGAGCELAEQLAQRLALFGFAEVRILPNGLTRWREAGLPVADGASP